MKENIRCPGCKAELEIITQEASVGLVSASTINVRLIKKVEDGSK